MNRNLLPLNIQFFAEESAENTSDETKKPDGAKEHMIPKSRFDEVNQRYRDVQAKLDKLLEDQELAEKRAQEEQGKFQELYQSTAKEYDEFKVQYENVDSRAKELEAVVNSLLETKLQSIPEEFHELIPDNLTPEAKLDWVNKAEVKGLFGKRQQQPIGEQTNGSEQSGLTKEQFSKMNYSERVKLFAKNPELYKRLSK